MNIFGLIFHRRGSVPMSEYDLNHEAIHTAQMKELLYLPFYIIYIGEWLYGIIRYRDSRFAYYHISFEQEAYELQSNLNYLESRKHFAQWRRDFGLYD